MPARTKIFIADDHGLVREGLRGLIESERGLEVVGEAGNGDDVVARAAGASWDLLLLDLSLPGLSGLDLLARLKPLQPKLNVLVLTMRPEDAYAVRLVRAGVRGYITKEASSQALLDAIAAVAAGGTYYSEQLEFLLLDMPKETAAAPHESFSEREFEIFRLYVGGLPTKSIAAKLAIDASTVSTHLKNVRLKLGVATNRQIISYAADHKLLSTERA